MFPKSAKHLYSIRVVCFLSSHIIFVLFFLSIRKSTQRKGIVYMESGLFGIVIFFRVLFSSYLKCSGKKSNTIWENTTNEIHRVVWSLPPCMWQINTRDCEGPKLLKHFLVSLPFAFCFKITLRFCSLACKYFSTIVTYYMNPMLLLIFCNSWQHLGLSYSWILNCPNKEITKFVFRLPSGAQELT